MQRIGFSLFFIMFFLSGIAKATPIQWKVEDGGNNHFYHVVGQTTDWLSAKQFASEIWYNGLQGHLATITSQNEQNWLWDNLPYSKKWLGGYQADNSVEPDKGWVWITGEEWGYTNWRAGEPNDNLGDEDYLVFSGSDIGEWNDQRLDGWNKITGYVVEFEPVPEPTTLILLGTGLLGLAGISRRRRKPE